MLDEASHVLLSHLMVLRYFLTTGLRSPHLLVVAIVLVLPAKAAIFRVLDLICRHEVRWLAARRSVHRRLILVVLLWRFHQFLLYLLIQRLLIHTSLPLPELLDLLLHLLLLMKLLILLFELVVQPAHL